MVEQSQQGSSDAVGVLAPKFVCTACNMSGRTRNEACRERGKHQSSTWPIAPWRGAIRGVLFTLGSNVVGSIFLLAGAMALGLILQLMPVLLAVVNYLKIQEVRSKGAPSDMLLPYFRAVAWGIASVYLTGLGLLILGRLAG